MKKIIVALLVFVAIQQRAAGQFIIPMMGMGDSSGMNGIDTPRIDTAAIIRENRPAPDESTNEADALEVQRLELQAQKLKLEKEIEELSGKKTLTPAEKELLKLKNENLKIVLLKEKILLEQEYDALKKKKDQSHYPESSIYGHAFFRNGNFKATEKPSEVMATENYVLGFNDVVQIELWGSRYFSRSFVISESGAIDIPGYQKFFVKGLTIKQAREMIASRLGVAGTESSFSLSVTRPRMVSVNILGEVFNPGTYTVPATNSAFNVLVSMGGPTNIGSVRNIYIKRDGKIRDSFDLYEYFGNAVHQKDIYLQNNDYIIVAPLSNVISVSGSVRRPGNYELKNGEGLRDLINFAGGMYPNTYLKDVVVSRIKDNAYEVLSVNLDSLQKVKKDFSLTGGESVIFKGISQDNQYTVLITGAVSVPGTYRIRAGMRISDVLKTANGLVSDAYLDRGYVVRTNKDLTKTYLTFSPAAIVSGKAGDKDLLIENRDTIHIFNNTEIQKFYAISINGAVYKPVQTRFIAGIKLSELLFMAGGITEDADPSKGFIIRTNTEYDKQLIPFEPLKVTAGSSYDFELMPRDEVTIYSKSNFKRYYTLEVQGPVKLPQSVAYSENTHVLDLINLAGGLEVSAYLGRALVIHTNLENGYKTVRTLKLEDVLKNPGGTENILLEKNDVLRVFDLSELRNDFQVSIYGEVRKSGEYSYGDNMTLQNLVDLAGGFQFTSAGTTVEVIRNFYLKDNTYQFLKPEVIFTKISDNLTLDKELQNMILQPFDRVFIRVNPNYMPLKMVYIGGAVFYPGFYALLGENEKLSSVIRRAGGFRPDAMARGMRVKRINDKGDTIQIVVNTMRAVHYRHSHYNIILRSGDSIYVPYSESLVTLTGDMNKFTSKDIGAYYVKRKRARYYIRNFGGGFTETSNKKKVVVEYANGARVGTRNYILFKIYPKVKPGSKIIVASKPEKTKSNSAFNMDVFLTKMLTRVTAVLSMVGLYKIALSK